MLRIINVRLDHDKFRSNIVLNCAQFIIIFCHTYIYSNIWLKLINLILLLKNNQLYLSKKLKKNKDPLNIESKSNHKTISQLFQFKVLDYLTFAIYGHSSLINALFMYLKILRKFDPN